RLAIKELGHAECDETGFDRACLRGEPCRNGGASRRYAASEGDPASTAAPACRKAEVNPVTGHVLCIDPIGAPVQAPPAASEAPYKPDARLTASLKSPARVDEPTSRTFSEIRFALPRFALFERDSILCHRLRAT